MPRPYQQAERRLIAEWATARYPGDDVLRNFNLRVGAGPPMLGDQEMTPEEWRATVGQMRRYVDAVIVTPTKLVIAEAKVVAKPDALGQILLYRQLVPHTPELLGFSKLPIESVLVVGVEDPALTAMARSHNVLVDVFSPDWIQDYLKTRAHRQRIAPAVDASTGLAEKS